MAKVQFLNCRNIARGQGQQTTTTNYEADRFVNLAKIGLLLPTFSANLKLMSSKGIWDIPEEESEWNDYDDVSYFI